MKVKIYTSRVWAIACLLLFSATPMVLAANQVTVITRNSTNVDFAWLGLTVDRYSASQIKSMNEQAAESLTRSINASRWVMFSGFVQSPVYKAVFSNARIAAALKGVLDRGGLIYIGPTSWEPLAHIPRSMREFFKEIGAFLPTSANERVSSPKRSYRSWVNTAFKKLPILNNPVDLSDRGQGLDVKAVSYWTNYPSSAKAIFINPKTGHVSTLLERAGAKRAGRIIFTLSYSLTRMARSPLMKNLATAVYGSPSERDQPKATAAATKIDPDHVIQLTPVHAQNITIDGKLNEPFWSKAAHVSLSLYRSGDKPTKPTQAIAAIVGKRLMVGFRCREPHLSGMHMHLHKRDGALWKDDCVEVFVSSVSGGALVRRHWIVSANGALFDEAAGNAAWNSAAHAAAAEEPDNNMWTAELSIPLEDIFKSADYPKVFRINFAREEKQTGEISSWLAPIQSLTSPANLGYATTFNKVQFSKWLASRALGDSAGRTGWMVWNQSPWITGVGPRAMPPAQMTKQSKISMTMIAPRRGHADATLLVTNFNREPLTVKVTAPASVKTTGGISVPFGQLFTLYRAIPHMDSYQQITFDPLLKLGRLGALTIPAGRSVMIWIDAAGKATPGVYKTYLKFTPITTEKVKIRTANIQFNIADVQLPDPLPVQVYTWGPYIDTHNPESWAVTWRMAAAFHINHVVAKFPFTAIKDGPIVSSNMKDYVANAGYARDVKQAMKFGQKLVFSYWLFNSFDRSLRRHGFKGKQFDKAWRQLFLTWMQRWQQALKQQGIGPDQYLVQIADEPHGNMVELLVKEAAFLKKHFPQVPTVEDVGSATTWKDIQALSPYVDVWIPHQSRLTRSSTAARELKYYKQHGPFWTYLCSRDMDVQSLLSYYRYRGIRNWSLGSSGIAMWVFSSWQGDPWSDWDARRHGHHGEGLFYPTWTGAGLTPSIRAMAFRQGIEDYVLLKMLQKQRGADAPDAFLKHLKGSLNPESILKNNNPAAVMQWKDAMLKALSP